LILETVERHEAIMDEPKPTVFFIGFADGILNFILRAHCADLDNASATKDELLTEIEAVFREHGILLPFPQRDIHVHGIGALPGGELKLFDNEGREK
ncbi:MAG: mechanosensitive ion channel, partial [Candidatus Hydrogenedentes bacterium]|nr:mechanosensitive ion channel [Candidatus Hydrogenedentota bacterium]